MYLPMVVVEFFSTTLRGAGTLTLPLTLTLLQQEPRCREAMARHACALLNGLCRAVVPTLSSLQIPKLACMIMVSVFAGSLCRYFCPADESGYIMTSKNSWFKVNSTIRGDPCVGPRFLFANVCPHVSCIFKARSSLRSRFTWVLYRGGPCAFFSQDLSSPKAVSPGSLVGAWCLSCWCRL